MTKLIVVFKQLILPLMLALMLALLFRSVYMVDGNCNYFLAWVLIGFPFGIRKMFLVLVPSGYDLAGTVGIFCFSAIIGGIIGGFALIGQLIKGIACTVDILFRR